MEEKNIIFGPDRNLGSFIAKQCPEKNIVLWNGFCPTHHLIKRDDVLKIKETYPKAELLVHPECSPEVTELADYAGSTKGIIDYAAASECEEFIIGTEVGVMYQLKKNNLISIEDVFIGFITIDDSLLIFSKKTNNVK